MKRRERFKLHLISTLVMIFLIFLALGSTEEPDYKKHVYDAPTPQNGFKDWLVGKEAGDQNFSWIIEKQEINNLVVEKITNETGDKKNYAAYISFRVADGTGRGVKVKGIVEYKVLPNTYLELISFQKTESEKIGVW